jgi:hypothetical protein
VRQSLEAAGTIECHDEGCVCASIRTEWNRILLSMLNVDPKGRPQIGEVYSALEALAAQLNNVDLASSTCRLRQLQLGITQAEIDSAFTQISAKEIPVDTDFAFAVSSAHNGIYGDAVIQRASFRILKSTMATADARRRSKGDLEEV